MPTQPFGFRLTKGQFWFWDDLRFPATLQKQGANTKPDFDYTNLGLLMPQNDATEVISLSDQFPHGLVTSLPEDYTGDMPTLGPHVHFIQTGEALPVFKLAYRIYDNGATVPDFTTISTADGSGAVFSYSSGSMLQILPFPRIPIAHSGLSAWFDAKLYREDNVVTGDVLLKGFDLHEPQDSAWGSLLEWDKV